MGESIVYAIKSALVYVAVGIWTLAIISICSTVVSFTAGNTTVSIISTIFGIISMCLPFKAGTVFGSILSALIACSGFIIARKVYSIVMKSNEAT